MILYETVYYHGTYINVYKRVSFNTRSVIVTWFLWGTISFKKFETSYDEQGLFSLRHDHNRLNWTRNHAFLHANRDIGKILQVSLLAQL
jgi:hypothetical protein